MYEIYDPAEHELSVVTKRNQLRLGDHGSAARFSFDPSLDAPRLYIYPLDDRVWDREKSWLAQITGVSDDWSIQRDFLPKSWIRSEREEFMEYVLGEDALYEVECELSAPMVEQPGTYRIYLRYIKEQGGIALLTRAMFMDEVRGLRAASFGEVRALVAGEKWGMARRAASWLSGHEERGMAADYVEQCYQRWLKSLPELEGSEVHVQWARALREEVLSRWPEIARELRGSPQEEEVRMPREALDAFRGWLLHKQDALFWVEQRGMLTGQALWEIYLLEQLSVED